MIHKKPRHCEPGHGYLPIHKDEVSLVVPPCLLLIFSTVGGDRRICTAMLFSDTQRGE